jgi:cytochrome c-type biogenesis protein CcmE
MLKQYRTIIGVAAIVIFGGLGLWSLRTTATPYVDFGRARTLQTNVQVLGKVIHDETNYDGNTGVFSFYIVDENGDKMQIQYSGTKPGNFEQAESVVCVGKFSDGVFRANNLLVKCPSKYQGTENQKRGA